MPSSLSVILIGFGAVLTSVSAVAGTAVAGVGLVWETLTIFAESSNTE